MNEIDFLPQDYVCVQTKRNKSNWLRGLFAVVLVLMAVGWGAQQQANRELGARRSRMQDQAAALLSRLDSPSVLKAELNRLENEERLIDVLRTNVPPSRWLAAIVAVLPPLAVISDIRAETDEYVEPIAKPEPGGGNKTNENASANPVELDLQRLTKFVPRRSLTISIRGSAADDLEVSSFLNALHQNAMFERVQLLFTDQQVVGDSTVRSFAIRLRTQSLLNRTSHKTSEPRPSRAVAAQPPHHSSDRSIEK